MYGGPPILCLKPWYTCSIAFFPEGDDGQLMSGPSCGLPFLFFSCITSPFVRFLWRACFPFFVCMTVSTIVSCFRSFSAPLTFLHLFSSSFQLINSSCHFRDSRLLSDSPAC